MRGLLRLFVLIGSLIQVLSYFCLLQITRRMDAAAKAKWLHWSCRLILARLGMRVDVKGAIPHRGLIASNHLSYLDILIYAAVMRCTFVSKVEVKKWPLLGLAAKFSGTVFVDRSSAASAAQGAEQVGRVLEIGVPVLLFPEGTSTDGTHLLRFHSSFFEPAVIAGEPITAAAITYHGSEDGGSNGVSYSERDLCYYGDVVFAPHLLKTLSHEHLSATVQFALPATYDSRRRAAFASREDVAAMREALHSVAQGR